MSVQEIVQRNELTTLLLNHGYNVFLPVYDDGIDMIVHRRGDHDIKLVQQKSRWTIARKYCGRQIWIAFRDDGNWFLAPHDDLVKLAERARYTATSSWTGKGTYHRLRLPRALRDKCERYRLT